jgi:hypothetical protein
MLEAKSGDKERAIKHWTIAASAGCYCAMNALRNFFEIGSGFDMGSGVIPLYGSVSKDTMESTLEAYNNSCAGMRSKARDAHINMWLHWGSDEEKSIG